MNQRFDLVKKRGKIKIFGNSMFPILVDGDIAHFRALSPHQVKVNDIICFKKRNRLISHRVVYSTDVYVISKGDNNSSPDGRIYHKNILGRIERVERKGQITNINDLYLFQSSIYYKEIEKITRAFNQKNVDYVILKGLPLYMHYENKHPRRIYSDCDILVSKRDSKKVEGIFRRNRYERVNTLSLTGDKLEDKAEISFHKIVDNFPVIFDVHREAVFLMSRVGEVGPLYPKKLLNQYTQNLLDSKVYVFIESEKYPVLNSEQLLVYLFLHLFNHNFKGVYRYIFIESVLRSNPDPKKVLNVIKEYRLETFIYPVLLILKKYFNSALVSQLINSINLSDRKLKYIRQNLSKINIFQDHDHLGNGEHFRLLFNLSPNPFLVKILVFFDGKIIYSILWIIYSKIKKKLIHIFPFFSNPF